MTMGAGAPDPTKAHRRKFPTWCATLRGDLQAVLCDRFAVKASIRRLAGKLERRRFDYGTVCFETYILHDARVVTR